jgi:hypothetical protein
MAAGRRVLFTLLAVVAAAAGLLSFSALRDLAVVCGFARHLAWLLPVVIDAGAAAGSLVWLGGADCRVARRFGRALAIGLLTLSVAANALGHVLEAFRVATPWWVVVVVSAVSPGVLGAVVHLAVLVGRLEPATAGEGDELLCEDRTVQSVGLVPAAAEPDDRADQLIAAGVGRRRLSRELGMSEHEARQLLRRAHAGDRR